MNPLPIAAADTTRASKARQRRAGLAVACFMAALLGSTAPYSTQAQQTGTPITGPAPDAGETSGTLSTLPAATVDRIVPQEAADPALELRAKRDEVSTELRDIAASMKLSEEKAAELQQGIEELEKTSESLKTALIESAKRRKDIEKQISEGERRLADIGLREDGIRASFRERRSVLAEVLAALQRMGRNPPPALLVSPEDALGSVRTAILLGAVVPGIRHETDKLAADLEELIALREAGKTEMDALVVAIAWSRQTNASLAPIRFSFRRNASKQKHLRSVPRRWKH